MTRKSQPRIVMVFSGSSGVGASGISSSSNSIHAIVVCLDGSHLLILYGFAAL